MKETTESVPFFSISDMVFAIGDISQTRTEEQPLERLRQGISSACV